MKELWDQLQRMRTELVSVSHQCAKLAEEFASLQRRVAATEAALAIHRASAVEAKLPAESNPGPNTLTLKGRRNG